MEIVGALSGAALGYIQGNTRGAIKGWKLGRKLSQSDSNMPPYKKRKTSNGNYKYKKAGQGGSYTSKRGRSNKMSFHKQMLKNTPAKHDTYAPTQALKHNNIYSTNITEQITQGFTNEGRDGDSIFLEAVKLRGIITSATAAGAYSYRLLVGFTGEEITTGATFNVTLSTGQLFLPNGASQLTSIINPKAFTCIYDQVFDINSQIAGIADVHSFVANISLKQKFLYQNSASIYGKTKNLHLVVIGNVFGGTSDSTSVGEIVVHVDTIFK